MGASYANVFLAVCICLFCIGISFFCICIAFMWCLCGCFVGASYEDVSAGAGTLPIHYTGGAARREGKYNWKSKIIVKSFNFVLLYFVLCNRVCQDMKKWSIGTLPIHYTGGAARRGGEIIENLKLQLYIFFFGVGGVISKIKNWHAIFSLNIIWQLWTHPQQEIVRMIKNSLHLIFLLPLRIFLISRTNFLTTCHLVVSL